MSYFMCGVCGKGNFKSKAGLLGHRRIVHGIDKRKVYLDEVGEHLASLQKNMKEFHDLEVGTTKKIFAEISKSWEQSNLSFRELDKRLLGIESEIRTLTDGLYPFIKEL